MFKTILRIFACVACVLVGLVCFLMYIVTADAATGVRTALESGINLHLEGMRRRAARGQTTTVDVVVLHGGILAGAGLAPWLSPEGYAVLRHAAYGQGEDLELGHGYFSRSPYLQRQVSERGVGRHGPLWVQQQEDWRLSLTFNPYYLTITEETVRISHPTMRFQKPTERRSDTIVPIGKMRIIIPDNLVGALQQHTFRAYAEWER